MCHALKANFRVGWLIGVSLAALVPIGVERMARAVEEQGSARADEGPAALTVSGSLEDALFGKPIKGAKLVITKFDKPRGEGGKEIERIEAVTDEEGKYRFQLPTGRAWKGTTNDLSSAARFNYGPSGASVPVQVDEKVRAFAQAKIKQFDRNNNGQLERDEWSVMSDGERYDLNKDGIITLDEMIQYLSRPGSSASNESESASGQVYPLEIEIRHANYAPFRTDLTVRRVPEQPGRAAGPLGTARASVVYGRIVEVQPQSRFIEGFGQPGAPEDSNLHLWSTLELRPAKDVTGILQSPEGKPVAGVRIFAHSQVPRNERETAVASAAGGGRSGFSASRGTVSRVIANRFAQSEDECFSDAQGRFHVSMITPGEGMIWIYPDKEFAPQMRVLYDERGDLGTVKLVRGTPITGRVLDADGKPLGGVFVAAYPWIATQPKYSSNIIEQRIHRAAESDAQGNFTLAPLPPGEYRVEPKEYLDEIKIDRSVDSRRDIPGLFVPQKLTVKPGEDRGTIELRGASTVSIDGHIVVGRQAAFNDAQQLHEAVSMNQLSPPTIEGAIGGLPYRQTVKIDVGGRFSAVIPKGLSDTVLQMYAQSDGAQPQWRLGADGHLQTTSRIRLGTLEKDFRDLQIVYPRGQAAGEAGVGAQFGGLIGGEAVQQPAQGGQGFGGRGGFGGGRGGRGGRGGFGGAVPQAGEGAPDGGPE